jgi:hypothetical protein
MFKWFKSNKELKNRVKELEELLDQKTIFTDSINYAQDETSKAYKKVFNGGKNSQIVFYDLFKECMMNTMGFNPDSSDYKQGMRDVMLRIMQKCCIDSKSIFSLVDSSVNRNNKVKYD